MLWIPGLFNGEHIFTIEPLEKNRVRFVQHEIFAGLLAPLLGRGLSGTQQGLQEMNQALKERAERVSTQ